MKKLLLIAVVLIIGFPAFLLLGFNLNKSQPSQIASIPKQKNNKVSMQIISPVFDNNGLIPKKYSCEGENVNPPLNFSNVPKETKSLVLVVVDPDAPNGNFVHWIIIGLNPNDQKILENAPLSNAQQGLNGAGKVGYLGPCPPSGTHHYHFTLYALDTSLNFTSTPILKEIENAMQNHVLIQTELVGSYQRSQL